MVSTILVWASLALLAGAVSVLVGAFLWSARTRTRSVTSTGEWSVGDVSARADAPKQSPATARSEPVHAAHIHFAYGRVVDATQQYVIEESSYVDLKAEIVNAFARLEKELDASVGYRAVSNFESEPKMEVQVA